MVFIGSKMVFNEHSEKYGFPVDDDGDIYLIRCRWAETVDIQCVYLLDVTWKNAITCDMVIS